jgi:hypothetical protein
MTDELIDTNKLTSELQKKYPNAGIKSLEVDNETGRSTFMLTPTKQNLAFSDKAGLTIKPRVYGGSESAATINRDFMSRQNLDLSLSDNPSAQDPKELFRLAAQYYYDDPMVGSVTNILASIAMKGFENDIDDENIKNFYDTWKFDVGFDEVLEWIFLDLFKMGHVTTYKVLAKYEPRVSHITTTPGKKPTKTSKDTKTTKNKASGKELERLKKLHASYDKERDDIIKNILKKAKEEGMDDEEIRNVEMAAKKNIWSKGHLPVAYTVLNPDLVNIEGNLLFDKTSVKLTPPGELGELLKKDAGELTLEEKELIKSLPPGLKKAAEEGDEFQLDHRLVGSVTYRKQPYERYAKPRSTRIFESLNYKKQLRNADLSTVDGISNYILKITIGNDEYPVTSQNELETVAKLFDTPSKAFDVVWNHTLSIEKVVSPEIEAILGQDKYKQVNEDIEAGLAVTRAIIDGNGDINTAEVSLLIKGLTEEINYARRQVEKWIYREYRQIAEAMGFDHFPKVRWDEGVLKDTILYMNTLATLVDRRMLSYKTALEALNFDYDNELNNMTQEVDLVKEGTFGILGSPWQQSKTQDTQNAPQGTPSSGRPKGQTKPKDENTDPKKQPGQKPAKTKKTASASESYEDMVINMNSQEFGWFLSGAQENLSAEAYEEFLNKVLEIRKNNRS